MTEVRIDGVLYVPVTEGNPSTAVLTDALVAQWAGEDWRIHYPDALKYLRVIVSDSFGEEEGESIPEFLVRVFTHPGLAKP